MTERCFIIQPFDKGKFDKRYAGVLKPAVKAADLDPYRVDHDPSVSIPVEQIEDGIRQAAICLADITIDNPNVWFELGFAIALNKDICLICSKERTTHYPFDVQHRSIISYGIEAPSDFKELQDNITNRLIAIKTQQKTRAQIPAVAKERQRSSELQEFEIACLLSIGNELSGVEGSTVTNWRVRQEMERLGYNNLATIVALRNLAARDYIGTAIGTDTDGDQYEAYSIAERGWQWINANMASLNLTAPKKGLKRKAGPTDEIPF